MVQWLFGYFSRQIKDFNTLLADITTWLNAHKWDINNAVLFIDVRIENNIISVAVMGKPDDETGLNVIAIGKVFDESEERQPDKITTDINLFLQNYTPVNFHYCKNEIIEAFIFLVLDNKK